MEARHEKMNTVDGRAQYLKDMMRVQLMLIMAE